MKKEDFMKIMRSKASKPLTAEDEAALMPIAEAVEQAFAADSVERNAKLESITKLLGSFDEGQSAASVIRTLATKVDELEAKAKRGLGEDDKFKLRAKLEEKKNDILAARKSNNVWAIEFKAKRGASALMTTTTILSGAGAVNTMNVMDDLEVLVIQYPKAFIVDAIGGRQVANVPQTLRWKEQNTESTSSIAAVLEGGEKKLTDKSFVWKSATREKYAGRIEFTEELAMDFDQLLLMVIQMFEDQVIRVWEAGIMTAIVGWASSYTSTEFDDYFVNPQVAHVIQALKLWVENNGYTPDLLLIRPGDAALARFIQDSVGQTQFLPDNIAFQGLNVKVSTNIPAGYMAVGQSGVVKEQHSNFIMRRGTYADQFIDNEETIVGEVFSLLKLPTVSKGAWVYANIDTMIETLAKPAV